VRSQPPSPEAVDDAVLARTARNVDATVGFLPAAHCASGAATAVVSALTPEQLAIVQTRPSVVPPRWREKFLRAVADQLALVRSPTNKDMLAICAAERRAICVGIGVPSVEDY